ncbi:hypothetical protein [Solibacillus sp. FSL K6-1554]|uniref:hypothetical protein n=1 Tax=Solibacillus sp. FSL K6-1554 TaxID=2921472 RepID=UPI0030F86A3A
MNQQNIEAYPHIQQVVKELELEPYVNEMEWHYFKDIDSVLSTILKTFKDLTSDSIPLRRDAKERATHEYLEYSKQLHVFVNEEARHELKLSNEDVTRLFRNVELGGARYLKK